MTSERIEWVEIIEPRTKEHMYANLKTGECVWDPPEGVTIKRTDSSQWWELFDSNTQRFYYYNVASQTTVWHKPQNCDIIPLAKLQTLKQNTDHYDRKDGCTQTSHSKVRSHKSSSSRSVNRDSELESDAKFPLQRNSPSGRTPSLGSFDVKSSSELLSSPHGRHSYRLPTVSSDASDSYKYCRHSQNSATRTGSGNKHKESGKSSDSSLSSAQGYRRLNEGGSLRVANSHGKTKQIPDNNYRILQESTSSQNITHVPSFDTAGKRSIERNKEAQQHNIQMPAKIPYSVSNSFDLGGISPTRPINTPNSKKKLSSESFAHSGKRENSSNSMAKHQSADYPSNAAIVSLTRSGSFMSTNQVQHPVNQQSISSQQHSSSGHQRKTSNDGLEGGSDDSMHEKYFKSVENTPVSRRRQTNSNKSGSNKKQSSDSSPQSPISPQNHIKSNKSARPSVLSSLSAVEPPPTAMAYNKLSASHNKNHTDFLNLDLGGPPELYLDKMRLDKQRSPGSCVTRSSNSPIGSLSGHTGNIGHYHDTLPKQSNSNSSYMKKSLSPAESSSRHHLPPSSSSHPYPNNVKAMGNVSSLDQYLSKTNIEKHNREIKNVDKSSIKRSRNKKSYTLGSSSDVEYDNGNVSPLYSNWNQEHLLPLQHYIMEQAKLSGYYGCSDQLDSDSFHSDSQSEHSFSGHEPDNEDSDHSDSHGDYLTHNYGMIDDVGDGVSYYAYQFGFDRGDREDISQNVENVLENERDNTQIYNNISRNHQFHISPASPRFTQQPPPQQKNIAQMHQLKQSSSQIYQHRSISPTQNRSFSKNRDTRESSSQHPVQQIYENQPPRQHMSQDIKGKNDIVVPISRKYDIGPKSTVPFQSSASGTTTSNNGSGGNTTQLSCMKECDIEKFAQDNLNLHSKGLFRKKSSVRDMLSWTSDAISRPMLALARDKAGKKMATELFKLVQIYMGDRKARAGMSLNSVATDLITAALGQQQLRDELYVQLCRQTTENPKRESLIRGWELMAICLSFVPPSPTFQPALLNYVNRHRDPTFATSFPEVGKWPIHVQISHYATVCCKRLDRIGSSGRKQAKKPSEEELEQSRNQILRDSMFGNTLVEVMQLQKDKFPGRKLPWIQSTLSEQVLLLNGKQTEGIFRVSADVDEVIALKNRLDRWEVPEIKNTMDAHAPASLLKLWYRELYDPLIPDNLYNECVQTEDPIEADKIINKLPELNKLVLKYLIKFLQEFAQTEIVNCTKMDSSNLAMVFAPNCLRCTSDDPKIILENARKEMAFIHTLIQHMDTSSINNLI